MVDVAFSELDLQFMRRALELARRGEGFVEPNPMVGCVVVRDGELITEGWHRYFGGPHAERDAIANAGSQAALAGATWYVTLEPCCHTGKTPPCTEAVVASKPKRVVIAMRDPFPLVNGAGISLLLAAGIEVAVGACGLEARQLCAPFLKRLRNGRPWVIAKWAMTLDGKIATRTGDSRWISSAESRRRVHALRGRVDGVVVGAGTAIADDPRLTARPPGQRVATRIVVDRTCKLPLDSQLVRTCREIPVRVFVGPDAEPSKVAAIVAAGVDVVRCSSNHHATMIVELLDHCGAAGMTNLLVEGGGGVLGAFHDAGEIDEVHAYIAPKLVGGEGAITPVAGTGVASIQFGSGWDVQQLEIIEQDVLVVMRKRLTGQ
jgi:diaminohydroxyphosphoribosylaminopyrimidine deaminase/5-amino-6-(5-phosphoribosylamino)uracil reductase